MKNISTMKNTSFRLSTSVQRLRRVAIFAAVLVMSMVNVGTMWGESQQHIQGVACSNPNNYPKMKINVKRYKGGDCSSWGEWEAYAMVKAGITFEGKQLFSGEYWTCNGLYNLQYQMLDAEDQWKEQYEAYAGSAVYDYYNNYVYNYDAHEYYSTLTFQKGHVYFDATGWEETDIKLTIGHANFQRYYGMSTVSGTNLYYYHLDLNDAFADAMGFGVVGNTSASDGTNWLTNVSDKASEYTGYRHYGMNNSGGDICYLIVNKGKAGEQPDVDYDDDYTSLNSTQTFYSVVKEAGGNYTTANSKATISISSYELTSQGGTTNRTPSISTSANSTTVSACRTANTRLQIGTVATGYQFDGWWTGATSGSKVTESTDYTYNPTAETTLYARFSAKNYSITYKDQGNKDFSGTQAGAPTSHTYGAATSLKIPTKSGYTFGGWFTASDCASGAVGTPAAAALTATGYTANITLYAKWYANDYTFAVTEYAETEDTYKVNDVVKTSTGGSMKYTPVDDDSNARLYHYKDQYYVRFAYKKENYTDKSRVTVYLAKALKAGSIITATINNPGSGTRGLKLQTSGGTDKATWTSDGDGNHTYKYIVTADDGLAGTSQFMLQYASGISNLVTLTVANSGSDATYTISLNGNGGTGHTSSVSATAGSSTLSASITNPELTGYTFSGWYSGSGGTGDLVINTSGALQANTCYTGAGGIWAAGNVTLYAKWTANTYDITYKDCGGGDFSGSQTSAPTTHTYGTATTLKTATKDGTTFLGWFDNVACTGTAISSLGATAYTDDITLYAKWTTTLYDSYFYQTYNYDNTSTEDLISYAGFPFYLNTTTDNRGYSTLSAESSVTTPHDFAALDESHQYYYLRANKTFTLTALADVKAVHFYLWSSNTDRKVQTTAKMVSGTGDDLTISDVTFTYGNDGTVREYVVNISSATGYSSSNYYDYTFTFQNGDTWLWGIYVEKYTNVPVTAVVVSTSDTTLITGETLALTYTLTPDNTTDKTVTWSSSNTYVATVSAAGVVTAVAAGSATITATANDGSGETATCAVKVETCESFHGTIYSLKPNTAHNYSTVEAGTKDEYTAYADVKRGGRVWMGNSSAESTIHWNACNFQDAGTYYQINLNDNNGYLILNLGCALRNGDTIVFVPGAQDRELAFTTTATRSTTYASSSHKYVVADGDGLDGKDSIYVWQATAYQTTAKWIEVRRPTSYMLTYDANGGSGAPAAERFITGLAQALSTTVPTRTGYTFAGWNTRDDGKGTNYDSGGDYTIGGSAVTLYAKWTANVYTVEEHNNGGRIWSDSIGSYTYGVGATLPTNITKWGYDFDGWYDNEELDGDPVTAIGPSETGNKNYYAKWTSIAQEYAIADYPEFLAAQEGDIIAVTVTGIHTSAAIYLYDLNYTEITHLSLSATGKYTFQLTAAQATGLREKGLLVTGNNFTFDDVNILYRKTIWTGTISDNSSWAELVVDKTIFSGLAGGDFLGFNITAISDKGSYHNYAIRGDYDNILSGSTTTTGIAIVPLSSAQVTALKDSNRIDVVAQYLDISNLYSYTHTRIYTVTLTTNGGTINAGNVTSYTFGTGATLPTNVTKTGYTFAGWYDNSGLTGSAVTTITTSDYGNKEYWAKWTAITYSITYKDQGGEDFSGTHGVGYPTSHTYGASTALVSPTKTGYTFGGWYEESDCSGDAVTSIGATDKTTDITLYAKWTPIVYNINYDMNGGEWKSGWVGTRTYGAGDQALSSDVTKDDYNFGGWYDNGSFTGDAITAVSSTLADDITLYAKWSALSKTTLTPALNPIICTASEGDVVVVTVSATQSAGAYIQLEDKDGVAFGDSLPVSGAGTYAIPLTSAEAAKVNAGLVVSGSNYTISAVTIKYQKTLWNDGIDGTGAWASDEVAQSVFSDLSAGDFLGVTVTKTNGGGYYSYRIQINNADLYEQRVSGTGTFIHQLTSAEITSLKSTDKTITIASGNSALSALYTYVATKNYTITLDNQSATSAGTESISVTFDANTNLTSAITVPTKICYAFGGYYTETAGGGSQIIDADGNVNASVDGYTDESKNWIHAGDVTLYAKWTQVNLAKSKTAYSGWSRTDASTGQNDGEVPSKAVDGSLDSHHIQWAIGDVADNFETRGWWAVNLGDNYVLSDIKIYWQQAGRNPYSYEIQAAITEPDDFSNDVAMSDDTNWRTIKTISGVTQNTGSTANVISFTLGEYVTAHYLRLVNRDADRKPMAISEFEVFGYGDEECYAANTPTASFEEIEDGQIKLNLSATNTNGDALTNFAVLYDGVYYDVTASEGVGYLTLPTHRDITVRVYAYNKCMQRSSGYVDVEVGDYVNPEENLALNKDAYACQDWHDQPAKEGIDKANDGDLNTYWTSYPYNPTTNEWWYVDLGDFYDISRIEVEWKSTTEYYSTDYSIQYRQNAPANNSGNTSSEWDAISEFTNVTSGNKSADLASSVGARYICLRSAARYNSGNQLQLAELRVFGSSYGTPDETAPVWTDAQCAVTSAENHTITMTLEAVDAVDGAKYDFVINIDNGTTDKDYERSTTALSNAITITDASMIQPCVTYTITAKCKDHVGNEATKTFSDVTTSVSDDYNLALSKTTAAGISEGGDNGANAVDGNKENQWSGNATGKEDGVNQWMYVDLGQNYDIDSIMIMWGNQDGSWPQDYKIQVSYDGTNFRTIVHRKAKDASRTNSYADLGAKGQYVRVWADKSGTAYGMCITELEVYGGCYSEGETTYLFTGQNATSTTWSTAANWDIGEVPTSEKDVVLVAPAEVDVTNAVAKSIVIDQHSGNTGKLTIAANKALVVAGKVQKTTDGETLSATEAADLKIESSSDGNGTLIFTNDGNAATVEMYSRASAATKPWSWQYIGVPFTSANAQESYYGSYMYAWPSDCSTWEPVTKSTTLTAFTGYLISHPTAGHKYVMDGELAATPEDSIKITVPAGSDMVVGNSWTAPIQITQMTSVDFVNVENTVNLFNAGMDSEEQHAADPDEGDRYAPGTYVTIPINSAPSVGVTKISSLQGFYVTNSSGSAGKLKLLYSKHVRPTGTNTPINGQMHAPKRMNYPTELKIKVSGSRYDDRLILLEREDFSTGFDNGWDGKKLDDPGKQPMLYTTRPDGTTDAVSALPELDGTVISFRAGEDNEYTLRFEYAEDNEELYIYDTETHVTTQVVSGNTYTFYTGVDDKEAHDRFILTRNKAPQITTGEKPTSDSSLKGRTTKLLLDQKLYIYRNGVLYDATGRRVDSFSVGSGFDANANANAEQEKGGAE